MANALLKIREELNGRIAAAKDDRTRRMFEKVLQGIVVFKVNGKIRFNVGETHNSMYVLRTAQQLHVSFATVGLEKLPLHVINPGVRLLYYKAQAAIDDLNEAVAAVNEEEKAFNLEVEAELEKILERFGQTRNNKHLGSMEAYTITERCVANNPAKHNDSKRGAVQDKTSKRRRKAE